MNDAPMIPAPAVHSLSAYPIAVPWPLTSHLRLPAVADAVPVARQHARLKLAQWHTAETWAAEMVVSELCTNAVAASTAPIPGTGHIRIWLCSDRDMVLVQVWDSGDGMPALQDARPDADHGRGLIIVAALSKDCGAYRPAALPGKVTWALLAGESLTGFTPQA